MHNALLLFRQGNPFLDFYIDTAQRLLQQHRGGMPPQFIGPKLLTALHNVVQLPVLESIGMFSPMVVADLLRGGGPALELLQQHSPQPLAAANLCTSSCERGECSSQQMAQVIEVLSQQGAVTGGACDKIDV